MTQANLSGTYTIYRNHDLPPLSWLFQLGWEGARLTCGEGVESVANGFFEGAWTGSFAKHGFHESPNVFGSGASLTTHGWVLVPPSHTLEAIYLLKVAKAGWFASNSLAFLLTSTGAQLSFRWPKTLIDFIQIVDGITASPGRILTSIGYLYFLHYHNALLGPHLQIQPKPGIGPFAQYQDYRIYLENVVAEVAENATHPHRRTRYQLLATVSSGYDSPACAALARSAGCRDGLTFLQSRDGQSDDGRAIGQHLGLQMLCLQHPLFSDTCTYDPTLIAEFFSTGTQGEDITYAPLSGLLRERLLVTGFYGGKIWDLNGEPSSTLQRKDMSGSSLGEFRLRENFIHLPLPFVGALQHDSVHAITVSPEMHHYAIGGCYDKPIPRRIAEEAGVPRALFGQNKKAISTLVFRNRSQMPRAVRHAVDARIQAEPISARILYRIGSIWYAAGMVAQRPLGARRLPAVLARIYCRAWSTVASIIWRRPYPILEHLDPMGLYVMKWALSVIAKRYRSYAMENSASSLSEGPLSPFELDGAKEEKRGC